MPRASRRSGSLATGILRATLIVGAATVAAALLVTFVGSYRLARDQARERMGAYLEVMRGEMLGTLSATVTVVDNLAATIEEVSAERVTARLLASHYVSVADILGGLVLLTPEGNVVASYPAMRAPLSASTVEFARGAVSGRSRLHHAEDVAEEPTSLWVARRVRLSNGESRILVGIVRTDFLRAIANRVASSADQRSSLVVDSGRLVIAGAGGPMLSLSTSELGELSDQRVGDVRIVAPAVGLMRGLWAPLNSPYDLGWRLLVVEPSRQTAASSLSASIPILVVLVIGGGIALAIAWLVARRLVLPLRAIETASYEAAKGAYIPPLKPDRDDEVGRLAEAFNAVGLRLNALHDVSRLLAGASQLDQVLDTIIEGVGHLLGPGMVAIYLTDEAEQSFRLARASGGFSPPVGPVLRSNSGPFARALASEDVETPEPTELPMQGWDVEESPCRVLVAPLVAGTEHMGVVVVLQHGRSEYSEAETEMVRTFTSQAAIGITKSRLFERETESRRIAESLRDVAEELVGPVSFADAVLSVGSVVSDALDGRTTLFAFEDHEALGLPPSEDRGIERAVLDVAAVAVGDAANGMVVRRGAHSQADELLDRFGASEMVIARIEPNEPYRGAFAVFSGNGAFEPRDVELVEGTIKIVTLALDNAYFFERSRVRARNLETIFRISQAVGSSLQLKVVLNRVLDVVQMIFAADAVSLMTYDASRRTVTTAMARGAISSDILHLEVEPGEDLPGRVFLTGEPLMLRDAELSEHPLAASSAELGLRSLLSVPLLARGSAVGVLTVFSEMEAAFDEEDMGLLQTFASQAALAIDTARLYSKEHEVAATLQRSILPEETPEFDEAEVATAYQPAGSEAEIGGDYYDVLKSPTGAIVIAVADVCGKGVEAATKTSMLKYSIRALVAAGFGPSACMNEINRMIAAKGNPSDIMSVWLGFLDVEAGRLRWANGGHPPGLVLRSESNEVLRLQPTGPILGAASEIYFDEETVGVGPGDTVLLYTDGVTETRDGNGFFGEGRVTRALRYGGSAKTVVERLLAALRRFAPGELRDDVAVVAVRLTESTDRTEHGSDRAYS